MEISLILNDLTKKTRVSHAQMIQFWMLNTLTRPSKNPQAAVVCRQGASMRSPRSWWVTRPVLFAVLFAVLVGQLRHTTNQVDCYFIATKIEDLPIFPVFFLIAFSPFLSFGEEEGLQVWWFLVFFFSIWLEQKTSRNVPTVTYSNLEFFFYMSWHGWCQESPGGKSRSGPCCFMNRIFLVLNRSERDNAKYMLHPDYHARASKEFLVCL